MVADSMEIFRRITTGIVECIEKKIDVEIFKFVTGLPDNPMHKSLDIPRNLQNQDKDRPSKHQIDDNMPSGFGLM